MGLFLGREPELAALESALADAGSGRGRLFLLVGEPGIGKTRLADELVARAGGAARVLWGRCWEAGGAPAFWPWIEILRPVIDEWDPAALAEELGPAAIGLAQVMPELRQRLPGLPAAPVTDESEAARFLLLDAIARLLRLSAARAPLLVVLDDLHAADEPSLRLLEFVARGLRGARMLVVGTYRDAEARLSPVTSRLLAAVEREGQRFPLRRLRDDEVAAFIADAAGAPPDRGVVEAVVRATEGTPLFVAEVVRLAVAHGLGGQLALPVRALALAGIQPAIRGHLARVSEETRAILRVAAAVGRDFAVDVVAAAATALGHSGGGLTGARQALAEAERAGLVEGSATQPARFRFSHMLIRETIYGDLAVIERERLHAEVARALESGEGPGLPAPDRLAALAHHHGEAGAQVDAAKVVYYCRRAGEEAMRGHAHDEAAAHLQRALAALERPTDSERRAAAGGDGDGDEDEDGADRMRVELLLLLAETHQRAGDRARARDACERAAAGARRLHDAGLLARVALRLGAEFSFAVVDQTLVQMLEEALQGLGEAPTPLHARLMARLAAARQPAPDPDQPLELARQAVALARRLDDRPALAAVLRDARAAYLAGDSLAERLELDLEALAVAYETGDKSAAMHALWRLARERLEEGDLGGALSHVDHYDRLALELRQPHRRWLTVMLRAEINGLLGNFSEALRGFAELEPLVASSQDPGARVFSLLSRLTLCATATQDQDLVQQQRRLEEAIVQRGALDTRFMLAMVRAATLEGEELRATIAAGGLDHYPTRFGGQQHVAELISRLGRPEIAAELYQGLLSREGRFSVDGCGGSFAHTLGRLAAAAGQHDDAVRHLERSVAENERIGARPWVAHSLVALAEVLAGDGGRAGGGARADELRARARGIAEALGMPGLLRRLGIVASAPAPAALPATAATPPVELQSEGEIWSLRHDGATYRFKDSKGLQLVAYLLRNPGRELHVLHLAGLVAGAGGGEVLLEAGVDTGPDAAARAGYRRRADELRADLHEAEANADLGRAARAREELEFLADELARGVGLGGRERATGGSVERARINIQRRIAGALRKIEEACPPVGRRLSRAIRTGAYCLYEPD